MKHIFVSGLICLLASVCLLLSACTPPAGSTENETNAVDTSTESKAEGITNTTADVSGLKKLDNLSASFLTDINRHGSLRTAYTPGAGVDPADVPQTDRSAIYGTRYAIRLTAGNSANPYYFEYYLNRDGEERLAVFLPASSIPLLLVFAPDLGSVEALCQAVNSGSYFAATLLGISNVDPDQGELLSFAFSYLDSSVRPVQSPKDVPVSQIGYVGMISARDGSIWSIQPTSYEMSIHASNRFAYMLENYLPGI